jgi:Peptidase C13 family
MSENEPVNGTRGANYLATLLRLWTCRKVERVPAGHSASIVVGLGAIWLLLWIIIDWWNAQPEPQFVSDNVPLFAWYALAILGLAALLRWRCRPTPAFPSMLALSMGLVPMPLLLAAAAAYTSQHWLLPLTLVIGIYSLVYLARGLQAFTGESQRAAAVIGIVFVAAFIWLSDALDVIPDVWSPREVEAVARDEGTADAESILFEQAARIDRALATIGKDASATPRAYFLGFAGVADEKVFAQEIGLASRVLAQRYRIDGRRLSLINDQRDLEHAPLASVSGLKYALHGLAARMNLDRDVLFLSLSSHGSEDPAIVVSNSQLPLNDLTDEDLAEALAASGIKWRIIIISACYAGAFIDSLKNEQTIIITAAAADRTSFGCSNDRDLTYFGEAFYRDALPGAHSLRDAFEKAKAAIAARERREQVEASKPQAYFGPDLEAKLASMSALP